MSDALQHARSAFQSIFGVPPEIAVRAPGRVNIIGEHTDYNHGYVLPMALEQGATLLASRRPGNMLEVYSEHFQARASISLDALERSREHPWLDYIAGVAHTLLLEGFPIPSGANIHVSGDLPLGAGLSSSASIEMGALALFEALGGFELPGPRAAILGQKVENNFLGVQSGIMDQFASRCCRAQHALFLDCRSLEFRHVPANLPGHSFLIADTTCPRRLSGSLYNARVDECRAAVEILRSVTGAPGTHLSDFRLEELLAAESALSAVAFRRARHVLSENERTLQACVALERGDVHRLGALLDASDESLRRDYEVTSPELDAMTAIARTLPGCLGARMTGAGFGGCTIHLVETAAVAGFGEALLSAYRAATGLPGALLSSPPAAGAARLF